MSDDSINNPSDQVMNDPSSFLFASLADFYRENLLFAEAIAMCRSGLEAQPDNIDGRMVLARCLLATGDPQQAREEAVKVLARQPEHAAAKRLIAEIDKVSLAASPATAPAAAPVPAPVAPVVQPAPQPAQPISPQAAQSIALFPVAPPAAAIAPAQQASPAMQASTAVQIPPVKQAPPAKQVPKPLDTVLPAPPAAPAQPQPAPAPQTAAEPANPADPSAGYARILSDLQLTPQVLACILVDESGFVAAEAYAGQLAGATDAESSAALAVNIFKTATEAMSKIKLGGLERVVIETATEKVFLRRAGPLLLLLSAESSVKMGLVAVNTKRAVERIAALARG